MNNDTGYGKLYFMMSGRREGDRHGLYSVLHKNNHILVMLCFYPDRLTISVRGRGAWECCKWSRVWKVRKVQWEPKDHCDR